MTPDDSQVRRDICKDCKLACDVRAAINHADPCAECPFRVFHRHSDCGKSDPREDIIRGAGDIIHAIALPIARVLRLPCVDPDTKKLRPESPCAARRKDWNQKLPLTSKRPTSEK